MRAHDAAFEVRVMSRRSRTWMSLTQPTCAACRRRRGLGIASCRARKGCTCTCEPHAKRPRELARATWGLHIFDTQQPGDASPRADAHFIMCLIWRFIVSTNNAMKYSNKIGQNTGMLKTLKNLRAEAPRNQQQTVVSMSASAHAPPGMTLPRLPKPRATVEAHVMKKAMMNAFVRLYQNLNSGSLRMNGRNSSSRDVGSVCRSARQRMVERGRQCGRVGRGRRGR